MRVSATEFKTRVGKYLELVDKEEIIITKNGREVAKLIPAKKRRYTKCRFFVWNFI